MSEDGGGVVHLDKVRRDQDSQAIDNSRIVAWLEMLLARAKSGEIKGLAYVISTTDAFGTAFTWDVNIDGCAHRMSAGASLLVHRINAGFEDDR